VKNVYASGWTMMGAWGVLAATMMNVYALADTILSDWLPSAEGGRCIWFLWTRLGLMERMALGMLMWTERWCRTRMRI